MKKISKILVAIMLLFVCCMPVFLSGCNNQVYINTTTNNYRYGEAYGKGLYKNGAEITITAVPKKGYEFVQWDDGNTDNPRKITVSGEETYKAQFRESQLYALKYVTVYRPYLNGSPISISAVSELEIQVAGDDDEITSSSPAILEYELAEEYGRNRVACHDNYSTDIYAWYDQYNVFDFKNPQSLKIGLRQIFYNPDLTTYDPDILSNFKNRYFSETLTISKNQMTSYTKTSTNEQFLHTSSLTFESSGGVTCKVEFWFVKI